MKTIKYISILVLSLIATSCMNDFDTPLFSEPPFGNNEIGEANTTIAQLKERFAATIESGVEEVTDDIIIEGVVVANDESGNIYKQFIINDATGAIVIGVNDVGLYAMVPKGQRVRIDCKGLHIGGYGKSAQIGALYNGKVGRMSKYVYPQHVRLIGIPDTTQPEIQPTVIDDSFFTDANLKTLPKYVKLEKATISDANGSEIWAAEAKVSFSNTVKHNLAVGSKKVILLASTYADFANEVMPQGELNLTGVLTRYNDDYQFLISHTTDVEKISE